MNNGWIFAEETLPEDEQRVLVCVEYPVFGKEKFYKRGVTGGKYSYWEREWKCDTFLGGRVIAWMPLPEIVKEG